MLAKEVVTKLSNSLAAVKFRKLGYTESKVKTKYLVQTVEDRQKKSFRNLMTLFQR